MTDLYSVEEVKNELIECFDSGESFLHLGLMLKRCIRFQVAILFEIDWKTITLVPLNFFPSASRKILKLQNLSIPFDSSIIDIFSQKWIPIKRKGEQSGFMNKSLSELPDPFILFPLKVKQRVLSAIGISGLKYKKEEELEELSDLFQRLSPVLEKNMLIDKSVRRNQRLETIIGLGPTTYFIINRTGYINEFIPCDNNFLGYTPEEVIRKPASLLFPMGSPILKTIWKQVKKDNNRVWGLVNLANRKRNLASLTVRKVLLKYTLQKEYYLVGIEPMESDLFASLSSDPASPKKPADGSQTIRVHICPENLRCIRRCGAMAQYFGEGKFVIENPSFKDERCEPQSNCLTEFLLVGNDANAEIAEK
jgi:hypothetical protein